MSFSENIQIVDEYIWNGYYIVHGDQFDGMGNFNGSIVSADYSNLRPSPLKFAGNIGVLYAYHSEESFFQIAANAFYYGRPDNTYTGINQADGMRVGIFTNLEKYLSEDYTFILHGSYSNRNQIQQTLVGGAVGIPFLYKYETVNRIYAGCFARLGDAIIPTVSLMMDKYTFGISYDIYSNALTKSNLKLNGFELSFSTGLGKRRTNLFRTLLLIISYSIKYLIGISFLTNLVFTVGSP
jgi:hypothetical protein